MSRFDCLIIGGGPAGLSTALTLARNLHSSAVFDSGEYHNDGATYMHTVPTWDHKSPAEFRTATRANTKANYDSVTYIDVSVKSVEQNPGGSVTGQDAFRLVDQSGKTWYGAKVVLASGCKDIFSNLPGYAEAWPTGIFHCLFCHGYEERGQQSSGILAIDPLVTGSSALHHARSALRITQSCTVYTNGSKDIASDVNAQMTPQTEGRIKVDARKIKRLEKGSEKAQVTLHFEDGSTVTEAFLAHMPRSVVRGPFCEQLGVEMTPEGLVAVKSNFNATSVHGVYAAGDITVVQKIMNNAVYSGCAAGAGIALQIQAEENGQKPLVH